MSTPYIDHLVATLNTKTNHFYLIRNSHPDILRRVGRKWYLMDIERTQPHKVIWIPSFRAAFRFSSEQMVEEFKSHWLKGRPVEIVRMEKR